MLLSASFFLLYFWGFLTTLYFGKRKEGEKKDQAPTIVYMETMFPSAFTASSLCRHINFSTSDQKIGIFRNSYHFHSVFLMCTFKMCINKSERMGAKREGEDREKKGQTDRKRSE